MRYSDIFVLVLSDFFTEKLKVMMPTNSKSSWDVLDYKHSVDVLGWDYGILLSVELGTTLIDDWKLKQIHYEPFLRFITVIFAL